MTAPPRAGDAPHRSLSPRTGSDYVSLVPPIERKIPQHTFAMENELWKRCRRIAQLRHETMSDVIRKYLIGYESRHRHLLDNDE